MVATISITAAVPTRVWVRNITSSNFKDYAHIEVNGYGNCFFHVACRFDTLSRNTHGSKEQKELRKRLITHVKLVHTDPHHPLHQRYTADSE
jgi:hypothetical protein